MNDWTDTKWTHQLGTERLIIVLAALEDSVNVVAPHMVADARHDLERRKRLHDGDLAGAPWWPLTDLKRLAYGVSEEEPNSWEVNVPNQTISFDWGDAKELAAGQKPEHPRSLSVNGVRYEPVDEVDHQRKAYEITRAMILVNAVWYESGPGRVVIADQVKFHGSVANHWNDVLSWVMHGEPAQECAAVDKLKTRHERAQVLAGDLQRQLNDSRHELSQKRRELDRLRSDYEARVKRHLQQAQELQQVPQLQEDLAQREATIGRALSVLHAVWDVSNSGTDAIRLYIGGQSVDTPNHWSDVVRWVTEDEADRTRVYLVNFLRSCAGAADAGEVGVELGKLLVNGKLMREAANLLESSPGSKPSAKPDAQQMLRVWAAKKMHVTLEHVDSVSLVLGEDQAAVVSWRWRGGDLPSRRHRIPVAPSVAKLLQEVLDANEVDV